MQKLILYIILLGCTLPMLAQQEVSAWKIADNLGTKQVAEVDTVTANFQDAAPQFRSGILSDFNGNLGSPLQSKEFFRRENSANFLFAYPYEPYLKTADKTLFYDTKRPYSNVSYFFGGLEDRLSALFTVNVNKKFNFGFSTDYIYGRGIYLNQPTNHFLGNIFGSYRGKHYSAYLSANFSNMRNRENGGISNPDFITNPGETGNLSPESMEVNLNNRAQSKLNGIDLMYHHSFSLGIERDSIINDTTTVEKFVPVTTFAHTLRFESYEKTYSENAEPTVFYDRFPAYQTFPKAIAIRDITRQQTITNVFSLSMNEEFNRLMRFGLMAFIENKHQPYRYIRNGKLTDDSENNTAVGGVLSKHLGQRFLYDVTGKLTLMGSRAGDFEALANLRSNIPLWDDSVLFSAGGFVKNTSPDYFMEFYESKRVRWDNSFDREFATRIEGKLDFPSWDFNVQAQIENRNNHLYFDEKAMPAQAGSPVQIIALSATKNFHLGSFHFEHDAVYQLSSNTEVVPLPSLLLHANWYLKTRLFKVLLLQLGAEARYFTEYYAPSYMPAIGQFFAQKEQKIGNYPFVDVYLNVHLTKARFFLKYSHANAGISSPDYFLMPNYPDAPATLRLGISWNFYD
jgi:hypothetical protein